MCKQPRALEDPSFLSLTLLVARLLRHNVDLLLGGWPLAPGWGRECHLLPWSDLNPSHLGHGSCHSF